MFLVAPEQPSDHAQLAEKEPHFQVEQSGAATVAGPVETADEFMRTLEDQVAAETGLPAEAGDILGWHVLLVHAEFLHRLA